MTDIVTVTERIENRINSYRAAREEALIKLTLEERAEDELIDNMACEVLAFEDAGLIRLDEITRNAMNGNVEVYSYRSDVLNISIPAIFVALASVIGGFLGPLSFTISGTVLGLWYIYLREITKLEPLSRLDYKKSVGGVYEVLTQIQSDSLNGYYNHTWGIHPVDDRGYWGGD